MKSIQLKFALKLTLCGGVAFAHCAWAAPAVKPTAKAKAGASTTAHTAPHAKTATPHGATRATATSRPAASSKPAAPTKVKPQEPREAPLQTPATAPVPAVVVPTVRGMQTWALLVGIGKYANQNINSLRYPAADATGIRDALIDPALGAVPPDHIKLLTDTDATRENIEGSVDFLKANVKEGDQIVVFLAGHGVAKGVGANARGFLLSTDVRGLTLQSLEDSAVDLRKFSNALSELPAAQFVMFVDACREDPTPGRGLKGNLHSDVLTQGATVVPASNATSISFFACSVGQRAFEDPNYKHGVFTYWILDALKDGAVPQQPDGAVDMGRLTSYVSERVRDWSKEASASGDYDVEQTPEAVTWNLAQPVVLMHVKRKLTEEPVGLNSPHLTVQASPNEAAISVDGKRIGVGSAQASLPRGGDYTIRVEAPGYLPVDKKVHLVEGYDQRVDINLQGSRGVGGTDDATATLYKRGTDAEGRRQWEVATAVYNNIITASPQFAPAYERLAAVQQLQEAPDDAIATLIKMTAGAPSVHAFSLLSRAYSLWAIRNLGSAGKKPKKVDVGVYRVPLTIWEAAQLGSNAADAAVRLDATSGEASLARGYAVVALDSSGLGKPDTNKRDALAAFGGAIAQDDKNAEYQLGYGYGIRYFAQVLKGDEQKTELERAVASLKTALDLRPDYYAAHRELAYCYHLLGQNDNAIHEYDMANACRGSADDKDEVAGNEVALAALHQQEAQNATGADKQRQEDASAGYLDDAKETSGDASLKTVLRGLQILGLGGSISSFLPANLQTALGAFKDPRGAVEGKIRSKGPFGMPF